MGRGEIVCSSSSVSSIVGNISVRTSRGEGVPVSFLALVICCTMAIAMITININTWTISIGFLYLVNLIMNGQS